MKLITIVIITLLLSSCTAYHEYTSVNEVCTVGDLKISAVSSNHAMADQEIQVILGGKVIATGYITQPDTWKTVLAQLTQEPKRASK